MNKSNFPIVYYRLPHEKDVCFLQSGGWDVAKIDSLKNMPDSAGFILYPFSPDSSSKPCFIQTNNLVKMSLEDIYISISSDDRDWEMKNLPAVDGFSKAEQEYCRNVEEAVKSIQSGRIQKVVLSRVKTIAGIDIGNPLGIFHELCIKYPSAFVSLVHIPDEITWITATPELLISCSKNEIKTVSLAGTKPVGSIEKWDDKEKMEQHIVTEYINEILEKHCKNIVVSGPEEVVAGNVKHLKTSFSATLAENLWSLVSALHPTPAVCGIPLDEAKQFIKETEEYDRKYYTGFLGPCNMRGITDLYVNLRCAELFIDGANLYVGGGVTRGSLPQNEWDETELKTKTLLFAFEKGKYEKK